MKFHYSENQFQQQFQTYTDGMYHFQVLCRAGWYDPTASNEYLPTTQLQICKYFIMISSQLSN